MLFLDSNVAPFDWRRLLWAGDTPPAFAWEVVFRCVVSYVLLLAALRVTGRRSVKQLSLFELSILIGLGSIAGDAMFYPQIPILHAVIVFAVVVGLYTLFSYVTEKSPRFNDLMRGHEVQMLLDGRLCWDNFESIPLTQKELFAELRLLQVEHLGQVQSAYSEATGDLSVLFFRDADVRPGLSIRPEMQRQATDRIAAAGLHACLSCGYVAELPAGPAPACPVCRALRWLPACTTTRIT